MTSSWCGAVQMRCYRLFLQQLNINTVNLSFTMSQDMHKIIFLDIQIHKDGFLSSSLYRKPTAGNGILHASSFHPCDLVKSISFGYYLRVKHNCFNEDTFKEEADKFRIRLLACWCSQKCLKRAFKRATIKTRQELI